MHLSIVLARQDFISPNNQPDSTKLGVSFRMNDVSSHKPSHHTNSAPSLFVTAIEPNKEQLNSEKSHAKKTDGAEISRLNQYPGNGPSSDKPSRRLTFRASDPRRSLERDSLLAT